MPTWYEVRVSQDGYLGRRGGHFRSASSADIKRRARSSRGYFIYDSTKPLDLRLVREDVNYIGIPFTDICLREYTDARQRLLFKNVIYVGALSALRI